MSNPRRGGGQSVFGVVTLPCGKVITDKHAMWQDCCRAREKDRLLSVWFVCELLSVLGVARVSPSALKKSGSTKGRDLFLAAMASRVDEWSKMINSRKAHESKRAALFTRSKEGPQLAHTAIAALSFLSRAESPVDKDKARCCALTIPDTTVPEVCSVNKKWYKATLHRRDPFLIAYTSTKITWLARHLLMEHRQKV